MIVRLYETFEDEKNLYLVQEYHQIYAVSARAESFSRGWSNMATSMKRTQGSYSRRSSSVSAIYTHRRLRTATSSPKISL